MVIKSLLRCRRFLVIAGLKVQSEQCLSKCGGLTGFPVNFYSLAVLNLDERLR